MGKFPRGGRVSLAFSKSKGKSLCMNTSMDNIFGQKGLLSEHLDHFEFREEQFRMASLVENALKEVHYLIVEAGTGIGKTLAYLIPAILSKKRSSFQRALKISRNRSITTISRSFTPFCPSPSVRHT
jgi:hypothetical protein